jgi:segregation and condensation protein A
MLPNRDLNLSYENLGMQRLLNLCESRRLEKQRQGLYQVGARFFDGSALTGDIELRTKGDVSIAVSFDHGCQAANLLHRSIVVDMDASIRALGLTYAVILKGVSSPLNFHLEQYDGPLDLLLDLIRKQQINIYDIPIASITSQYLDYMQRALELDIELSSEFVYMAATLIHIKSRMLLPKDPELEKMSDENDPRQELVDRLLEHERFKNAAEMLQQKRLVEEAIWSNPQIEKFLAEEQEPELAVTIFDLVKTLQTVLERAKNRPVYEVGKEDVSIPDMIRYLESVFHDLRKGESIPAAELFERQHSRRAMISLFLAILELVRRQALALTQQTAFGEIGLKKQSGFDAVLDESLTTIEQEYH